jgi:sarcosine oxidase delta subunit
MDGQTKPHSDYLRSSVNHAREEYVRDNVHMNGCENYFCCLRRAVKGTYIRPTPDHLAAFVDEAVFRFNVRRDSVWDRVQAAMRLIVGKRLTYSELTCGAVR